MADAEDESHLEEQMLEIEALQSIYMEDLQELAESSHPHQWNASPSAASLSRDDKPVYMIQVYPQREDDGDGDPSSHEFGIELYFAHARGYPERAPFAHVSSVRGLSVSQVAQCADAVSAAVEENAGMPMIFSLVTAVQEWVNSLADEQQSEAKANDPMEQERQRRLEEEERIQKLRKHGHDVTVDSFLAWREQFLVESAASREAAERAAAEKGDKGDKGDKGTEAVTGKAWFLQQQAPAEVEVEEYDEEAFVDESEDDEDGDDEGEGEFDFGTSDSDDDDDDLLDEIEATLG